MDAFEQVVSEILWNKGHWVWTSFKVELTSDDKRAIGRPTSPRWELDIVAYDAPKNIIHVVECKSYLDNPGLGMRWVTSDRGRMKLFTEPTLRKVVFNRLKEQMVDEGRCRPNPEIKLALACGNTKKQKREDLRVHFHTNGWTLLDEEWINNGLEEVSRGGYENKVSSVVAKLALREKLE
jgi:hypothetical protein